MSATINFSFPVRQLSNERVKLTPFVSVLHASAFFAQTSAYPELYAHMTFGPFADEGHLVDNLAAFWDADPGRMLYAVIDKTQPPSAEDESGALAGVMGYLNTSAANLSTEIGYVVTSPAFQRTHVTSNAIGLLLQYALEPGSAGGLGLRRVQWQCSSLNEASQRTAARMRFRREGVLRWDRVFPRGRTLGKKGHGRDLPPGANADDLGRDTVMYSLCWDDWEQGAREAVQAIMNR
ncbi:hypothetical protein MMC07_000939 [Pseudocyphellaria aurata]|nr:hypothetical protein [Pseudocyphellaria aurata]